MSHTTELSASNDPRTMVTPFAFAVAPDLLGMPLASPSRRLLAFLMDGALIALLSRMGLPVFLLAMALLTFQLWRSADEMAGQRWKNLVRWMLIVIFILWGGAELLQQRQSDNVETAPAQTETVDSEALSDAEKMAQMEATIAKLKAEENSWGIFNAMKNALTDVGFEFGWAAIYYSLLTALFNGQTAGKMLLGIRVVQLNAAKLTIWQCFNRYGGYAAGAATGLLGFAQILWDANRQAIHDRIANTVVIDVRRPRYALPSLNSSSFVEKSNND